MPRRYHVPVPLSHQHGRLGEVRRQRSVVRRQRDPEQIRLPDGVDDRSGLGVCYGIPEIEIPQSRPYPSPRLASSDTGRPEITIVR